jgi:hypothetical protein
MCPDDDDIHHLAYEVVIGYDIFIKPTPNVSVIPWWAYARRTEDDGITAPQSCYIPREQEMGVENICRFPCHHGWQDEIPLRGDKEGTAQRLRHPPSPQMPEHLSQVAQKSLAIIQRLILKVTRPQSNEVSQVRHIPTGFF